MDDNGRRHNGTMDTSAINSSKANSTTQRVDKSRSRFDKVLETTVDMLKVDQRRAEKWLADHTSRKCRAQPKLVRDYVLDYLKRHRYPDGKTIQIELVEMTIMSQDDAKSFLRRLWTELIDHQNNHSDKYLRVSGLSSGRKPCSSSSPSPSYSSYSHKYNSSDRGSTNGSSKYSSSPYQHNSSSSSHHRHADGIRCEPSSSSSRNRHSSSTSHSKSNSGADRHQYRPPCAGSTPTPSTISAAAASAGIAAGICSIRS